MIYFLSVVPVLILIVLSLTKGLRTAVAAGTVVTTALFFFWGGDLPRLTAVLGVSLLTTVNILMIVLGAAFLYNVMAQTGLIGRISRSMDVLHPSADIRFFLLAFGLTAFFEGVAGFGTPGAIVPLVLIALGYGAVLSISVVLLFDGLFSMFGAVGTPILTGLQIPLGLTYDEVRLTSVIAAMLMSVIGFFLLLLVFRMVGRQRAPLEHRGLMFVLYGFFIVPYCLLAWFVPELATVIGALAMLSISVIYLNRGKTRPDLKPWLPYALLALGLLLPNLWPGLKAWLAWEFTWPDGGTGITGGIRPLQSPLIPFLVIALGVALSYRVKTLPIGSTLRKVADVSLVLFPSVMIANMMIHSGTAEPSMVAHIAEMMSKMSVTYPLVSPFIGMTGTFITGSTTISNIVFGPSQQETAAVLHLSQPLILALQLVGASVGNAICFFNIIAAASVAGIRDYRGVLVNNLKPTLLIGLLAGIVGMALRMFIP